MDTERSPTVQNQGMSKLIFLFSANDNFIGNYGQNVLLFNNFLNFNANFSQEFGLTYAKIDRLTEFLSKHHTALNAKSILLIYKLDEQIPEKKKKMKIEKPNHNLMRILTENFLANSTFNYDFMLKKEENSTTQGNSHLEDNDSNQMQQSYFDKPEADRKFIAKKRRYTKTVTNCPHTDAKHYAKVLI